MKVAVVIPCYNVEEHVIASLRSVDEQSYPELDIVCVDDGSTDATVQVIEEFISASERSISLIVQQNAGACAARNRGMRESKGEYVQFLDADDVLHMDKIAHQVEIISSSEESPDLIVADYTNLYPDGKKERVLADKGEDWKALIRTKMGTTSANLWSREAVERAGGWREDISSSQDYELIFRMLKQGASVVYDGKDLTTILKRSAGSISQTTVQENWVRYISLRKEIKEFLTAHPDKYEQELHVLDQYIFMALRVLSQFDMTLAIEEFGQLIPRGFKPAVSKAISKRYVNLYSIFGFAKAEKILRLLNPGHYRK